MSNGVVKSVLEHIQRHFMHRIEAFIKKRDAMRTELEQELRALREAYAPETIEAVLGKHPLGAPIATPVATPPPDTGKRKSPGKKRRVRNALDFSQLKPVVIEVISGLTGEFSIDTVRAGLKEKGVKYQPPHLRQLLPRYIEGIKTIRKEPRRGGGPKKNVYKVTGAVRIRKYTETLTAAKVARSETPAP